MKKFFGPLMALLLVPAALSAEQPEGQLLKLSQKPVESGDSIENRARPSKSRSTTHRASRSQGSLDL